MLTPNDLAAVWLTVQLAGLTTVLLLALGTPVAWWLARTPSRLKGLVGSVVTLPLVLPPAVLGFYLLVLMGPEGPVGRLTQALGLGLLPFTFTGLVVASCLYSMPFVIQPLQQAFAAIGRAPMEAAATLRASPLDAFFTVALPLARPGFITAAVLGFAHTVGEFGVVLMIGGNIPGNDAGAVDGDLQPRGGDGIRQRALAGRRHAGVFFCRAAAAQQPWLEPFAMSAARTLRRRSAPQCAARREVE